MTVVVVGSADLPHLGELALVMGRGHPCAD